MKYTHFNRITKKNRNLIVFEGEHENTTGIEGCGTWHSEGYFAEIFEVGGHLVLQSGLSMKPFAIFHNKEEVNEYLKSLLNNGGTEIEHTQTDDRLDGETTPVRLPFVFE